MSRYSYLYFPDKNLAVAVGNRIDEADFEENYKKWVEFREKSEIDCERLLSIEEKNLQELTMSDFVDVVSYLKDYREMLLLMSDNISLLSLEIAYILGGWEFLFEEKLPENVVCV